uniref:Reverse transcriptase domain-containing protein n=1 Tax=Angiostrongylus cantonensis TaxID=6313 RepID=A0A0K0DDJ6_ANGCA
MGQQLAPTLAVAFISKLKEPVIDLGLLLSWRYTDDCFVVFSKQEEMGKCFELLNEQSDYVKFTREKLKENWLPLLNAQINLSENDYITKWYRKPGSKNMLIHYLLVEEKHRIINQCRGYQKVGLGDTEIFSNLDPTPDSNPRSPFPVDHVLAHCTPEALALLFFQPVSSLAVPSTITR